MDLCFIFTHLQDTQQELIRRDHPPISSKQHGKPGYKTAHTLLQLCACGLSAQPRALICNTHWSLA